MKLANRLARLEKVAATTKAAETAYHQRNDEYAAHLDARWVIMQETMSEEHILLISEAYAAGMHHVLSKDFHSPASALLRRCLDRLHRKDPGCPYSEIPPQVYLAMPPHVAEVYLAHPDALPLHECEDCGYKVPHQYFSDCPLCGGHVGSYAYWHKHEGAPRPESEAPT